MLRRNPCSVAPGPLVSSPRRPEGVAWRFGQGQHQSPARNPPHPPVPCPSPWFHPSGSPATAPEIPRLQSRRSGGRLNFEFLPEESRRRALGVVCFSVSTHSTPGTGSGCRNKSGKQDGYDGPRMAPAGKVLLASSIFEAGSVHLVGFVSLSSNHSPYIFAPVRTDRILQRGPLRHSKNSFRLADMSRWLQTWRLSPSCPVDPNPPIPSLNKTDPFPQHFSAMLHPFLSSFFISRYWRDWPR